MPVVSAPTDEHILELILEKGKTDEGFRMLVEKYQKKIYYHIRRMVVDHDDTDDVMQETFVKVWKNLYRFRQDSSLYTWIFRIASNEALAFLKRKKRRQAVSIENYLEVVDPGNENSAFHDEKLNMVRFKKALADLPGKQRLVFNMKYFEGMTYEQMAEVTGNSVGALKASYHHAVKKIEKSVTRY
jgi:RNA polymerase sigma-70 factor (ECF subfamily)